MNPDAVHYLNVLLGLGCILLQIFSVLALLILVFRKKGSSNAYLDFIDKHFLSLSFLISIFSSVFPLVYSDIVHFLPCVLCWWQRVFMFPTFFIFGYALWKKDRVGAMRYTTILLILGFLVSAYQNFFYYFGETSSAPCDATGVSCYQHLVSEYGGYISIPMMALTAFFALLTLVSVTYFYNRE